MIKSPFNFVPLNSKVFSPEWADQISQDIPFSDGVSGIIKLKITADSPIYIRNGQLNKEEKDAKNKNRDKSKDKDKDYSFSHITTPQGNRYFIPGTSIKGEVRNILEIMSYGKMCVDERAQFARRDLHNKDVYPLIKDQSKEHCGWLRRKGKDYEIIDCGRFWRISHDEIDRFLGSPVMRSQFSKGMTGRLEDEQKTADYKYRLIEDNNIFKKHAFEAIGKNKMGDSLVEFSEDGNLFGTIVFTGQPSLWSEPLKDNKGKYYEFVFPDRAQATRLISGEDFKHFEFIYKKAKGDKESEDWKRIKRLLEESEIGGRGVPVFFIPKGTDRVEHFGMTYLYKMPYDHSVFESLPKGHQDKDKRDLAECIFGYTYKDDSQKGRVQFGHAFASEVKSLKRMRLVLGSPKASYYPLYVSQNGNNGITPDYNTYDDGTPSGWKRYYVRRDTNSATSTGQDKVDTFMEPLDKGATFHGTVTFHNLRPVELGALLSALTFHNTPECRHQLGMAKAYGFGKCRYSIDMKLTASAGQSKDEKYYMARYEHFMSQQLATDWIRQPQLTELLTMAGNDVNDKGVFDFMTMSNNRNDNEFENAKKTHEYLQRASTLLPHIIMAKTLCNTPEFKVELEVIRKREEEQQAVNEERRRQEKLRLYIDEMKKQISLADNDNNSLNIYKSEIANKMAEEKDYQAEFAHLIELIDEKMEQNRQLELAHFKEDYEQRITLSGTDKSLLNNIKAELGNLRTDDKGKQDIITGLLAKIDQIIAQMPQAGFQDAFKTAIVDYKLFETRVKAGLRKTPLDKLTQADKDFGATKLQEAYDHDDKKSPKNWATTTGSNFKKCVKVVGNDIATRWFTALKR